MIKKLLLTSLLVFLLIGNCFAEVVDQEQTTAWTNALELGKTAGSDDVEIGQSFQLSAQLTVTKVEVYLQGNSGSPTGDWTLTIETNSSGNPSGTLADANATKVIASDTTPDWKTFTFATSFSLSGSTTYWIHLACATQASAGDRWIFRSTTGNPYANGVARKRTNGTWGASDQGAGEDLQFKVYVQSAAPSGAVIWIE